MDLPTLQHHIGKTHKRKQKLVQEEPKLSSTESTQENRERKEKVKCKKSDEDFSSDDIIKRELEMGGVENIDNVKKKKRKKHKHLDNDFSNKVVVKEELENSDVTDIDIFEDEEAKQKRSVKDYTSDILQYVKATLEPNSVENHESELKQKKKKQKHVDTDSSELGCMNNSGSDKKKKQKRKEERFSGTDEKNGKRKKKKLSTFGSQILQELSAERDAINNTHYRPGSREFSFSKKKAGNSWNLGEELKPSVERKLKDSSAEEECVNSLHESVSLSEGECDMDKSVSQIFSMLSADDDEEDEDVKTSQDFASNEMRTDQGRKHSKKKFVQARIEIKFTPSQPKDSNELNINVEDLLQDLKPNIETPNRKVLNTSQVLTNDLVAENALIRNVDESVGNLEKISPKKEFIEECDTPVRKENGESNDFQLSLSTRKSKKRYAEDDEINIFETPVKKKKKRHNIEASQSSDLQSSPSNRKSEKELTEEYLINEFETPVKKKKKRHDVEASQSSDLQSSPSNKKSKKGLTEEYTINEFETPTKKKKKHREVELSQSIDFKSSSAKNQSEDETCVSPKKDIKKEILKILESEISDDETPSQETSIKNTTNKNDKNNKPVKKKPVYKLDPTLTSGKPKGKVPWERTIFVRNTKMVLATINNEENSINIKTESDGVNDSSLAKLLEQSLNQQRLIDETIEAAKELVVKMPYDPPLLHHIETRIASKPTKEQRNQIKSLELDVKSGSYSKEEDDTIKRNWKQFCKLHELDGDPTLFLNCSKSKKSIMSMPNRLMFVRFLAHGLDNRLLCSVYSRFKKLITKPKLKFGRFTQEEDARIVEYMTNSNSPHPFADLAKILHRTNDAIQKRCITLTEEEETIYWTPDAIQNFVDKLLEITNNTDIEQLRDRNISIGEWYALSKELQVSVSKLKRAWIFTIHPRIFIEDCVSSNEIRLKLIDLFYNTGQDDWKTINWQELAKDFNGFPGQRLNKLFKETVYTHVPTNLQGDFRAAILHLKNEIVPADLLKEKLFKPIVLKQCLWKNFVG